jgi:hypothetical protein
MRSSKPLLLADPLPPLAGRIEVLVAEATLYHPNGYDGPTIERMLTAWIAVDPSESERRQARALAATFIAARCIFLQPADTDDDWIAQIEPGVKLAHVCIVLALPYHEAEVEERLRTKLAAVRNSDPERANIFVGVSTKPVDWATLQLHGHVSAERPAHQALHVFSMLAALMAPDMWCALDISDLDIVFGTASEPSQLAYVSCFPSDGSELLIGAEVKSMLEAAKQVAMMFTGRISMKRQASIIAETRAIAQTDVRLIFITPGHLTSEQSAEFGGRSLRLLCTPTSGPDFAELVQRSTAMNLADLAGRHGLT